MQSKYWNFPRALYDIHELHTQPQVDTGHNFKHLLNVTLDVLEALKDPSYDFLEPWQRESLEAAALLHEVDDPKLKIQIPEPGDKYSGPYPLAHALLEKHDAEEHFKELTLEIVSLVSTCSNHNTAPVPESERWKLLVRDADRIQALGEVGIARCYVYSKSKGVPMFLEETPRCQNMEQIKAVATPERFSCYRGISRSMIDHYYDKILHIGVCSSGNAYLQGKIEAAITPIHEFILSFGVKEEVDLDYLETLAKTYC
jgi:uncharacterized protein